MHLTGFLVSVNREADGARQGFCLGEDDGSHVLDRKFGELWSLLVCIGSARTVM